MVATGGWVVKAVAVVVEAADIGGGRVVIGAAAVVGAAVVVGATMSATAAGVVGGDAGRGPIAPIATIVASDPTAASGSTTRRRRPVGLRRVKPVSHIATATHRAIGHNSMAARPTTTPMTIHFGCPGYLLAKSTG